MSLDNLFGVHEHALKLRAKRQELIAGNLANADTPGYKARDIDFRAELEKAVNSSSEIALTHPAHSDLSGNPVEGPEILFRTPNHSAFDDNSVDIDLETQAFSENSLRYQATLSFISSRVKSVMTALKGQ